MDIGVLVDKRTNLLLQQMPHNSLAETTLSTLEVSMLISVPLANNEERFHKQDFPCLCKLHCFCGRDLWNIVLYIYSHNKKNIFGMYDNCNVSCVEGLWT